MRNQGYINEEQYNLALRESLVFTSAPYPIEAPHFVMMVSAQVDDLFSADDQTRSGPLVVRTTLDLNWQRLAERPQKRPA